MEKAAHRATELGLTALANLIQEEVDEYPEGQPLTAATVYDEIDRAVRANSVIQFTEIVGHVARCWGFSTDDLVKRFPRAEEVFDRAKQDAVRSAERRARFMATDARAK